MLLDPPVNAQSSVSWATNSTDTHGHALLLEHSMIPKEKKNFQKCIAQYLDCVWTGSQNVFFNELS